MICKNYRTLPQKEGYYLAKADYHIQERPGQRAGAVLVIDVNEGNKLYIKEVVIDGLHELDQGRHGQVSGPQAQKYPFLVHGLWRSQRRIS